MRDIKLITFAILFILAATSISLKAQNKAERTSSAHAVYGGNGASTFKAKKKKKPGKRKLSSKDPINTNRRKSAWTI